MSKPHPTREEILAIVAPRFTQLEHAVAWFEPEALPGFGSSTAARLVRAGRGNEVLDFVAAVDAGIFA